jgi:hypothetical protein
MFLQTALAAETHLAEGLALKLRNYIPMHEGFIRLG